MSSSAWRRAATPMRTPRPRASSKRSSGGGVPQRVPDLPGGSRQPGTFHRGGLQPQAVAFQPRLSAARRVRGGLRIRQQVDFADWFGEWGSLQERNYPIVIFDPHGDYSGLAEVPSLRDRVRRYFARFPLFEEDSEIVAEIVNNLGYPLTDTMRTRFDDVFRAAQSFIVDDKREMDQRTRWLAELVDPRIATFGVQPTMSFVANICAAGERVLQSGDQNEVQRLRDWCWQGLDRYWELIDGRSKASRSERIALRHPLAAWNESTSVLPVVRFHFENRPN